MFALFATLAAAGSAAEHTIFTAGVGLSAIAFGLFGFLWFLNTRHPDDERFHGAIDRKTTTCFVAWFFICIVLTFTNLLAVANLAHAVGALLGGLIAGATTAKRRPVPAAVVIVLLFAAIFARPQLNLSARRGEQEASLGYNALKAQHDRDAARWMRTATMLNPRIAAWWFNRAIAEARLEQHDAALLSYNNAAPARPVQPDLSSRAMSSRIILPAAR